MKKFKDLNEYSNYLIEVDNGVELKAADLLYQYVGCVRSFGEMARKEKDMSELEETLRYLRSEVEATKNLLYCFTESDDSHEIDHSLLIEEAKRVLAIYDFNEDE